MPGRGTAVRSGNELRQRVIEVAESLNLAFRQEVAAGRRLWGARRRIDLVLTYQATGKNLGVECKFQAGRGTAEEKIPATIEDMKYWPIPGIVVISGEGFSTNMLGYLMASGKVVWLTDLADWLRLYFAL
jgi:hypothetical protein